MKNLEFQIQHKTPRRDRGALRYFRDNRVDGIFSGLVPNADDARRADEQKQKEETQNKERSQRAQQQQPQQPQNLNQPKMQSLDQAVRDEGEHHETREARQSQQTQNQQALKSASQQDLKEAFRDQFQNNSPHQAHSELRSNTSATPSYLQNIRNLAGQNSKNEQNLLSDRGSNSPTPRNPNLPQQQGPRIADLSRFAGIQEHVQLSQQNTTNTANILNRSPAGRQAFNPESPFSRLPNQALPRSWNPQTFGQLIQQAASHLPEQHPLLNNQNLPTAAFLQGNMLFVKDGDRLRTFRLMEDGTLYETSHEHEGSPLTPEARAEMARVLKQKGIHARLSGDKESIVTENEAKGELEKSGPRQQDRSLNARGELRTLSREDSRFAHLLREVLEEGREVGQELQEGEDPHFASKSDWGAFFGRMLGMGSAEKKAQKTFDQIMSFIFRGLYKKQGESGQTLVSDIKYQLSGKLKEDKFAQIGIQNEQLLEVLKNLKPGQAISKDLLKQFMGEEISFIQLIHVINQSDPTLASELLKNIKFDPTANTNLYDQARLEHHIFSKSRKRPGIMGAGPDAQPPENTGPLFDGNAYNLFDKQYREVPGKVKIYTILTYAGILAGLFFLFYFIFKS